MNNSETSWRARWLALPILGLLGVPTLCQAGSASDPPLTVVEVEAVKLLRTLRDPNSAGPEAVGREVHALGSGTLEQLMRTLEQRRIPAPAESGEEEQILSEPQTEAVLVAFEAFGREIVLPRWEAHFEQPTEATSVAAAIRSLGAFGHSEDLERMWALARPAEAEDGEEQVEEYPAFVFSSLELATGDILARDPQAFAELTTTWSGLPEAWLDEVVRAAADTRDSRSVALLAEVFAWSPDQQRLIASVLPRVGPSDEAHVNFSLAQGLLVLLDSESKEDAQAAALALGVLEDFTVLPDLIEVLDDPRPGVTSNAHRALRELTGSSLGASKASWQSWHAEELSWFSRERRALAQRLTSREEHVVLAALREFARHRLNRHELAMEVAPLLLSHSEAVRTMCVTVLSELGSRWVSQDLVLALSDESESVRIAAHAALLKITGQSLGMEVEDWDAYEHPVRP